MEQLSQVEQLRLQVELLSLIRQSPYQASGRIQDSLPSVGVKRSTFYRWKVVGEKPEKRDELVEEIEQLCMGNHFIYG